MSGRIGSCTFSTGCNQQINAVAKIENEDRSAILGTVFDRYGNPIVDAVVVLLKVTDRCSVPTPLTHTFTDGCGQFVFGPLCPNTTYMLKIYKDDINVDNIRLICNCQVGSCLGRNNASNGGRAREGYNNSNNNCNCNKCN
jgi:hypothetical protein